MQLLHRCAAKSLVANNSYYNYFHLVDVASQHLSPSDPCPKQRIALTSDSLRLPDVKPPCLNSPGTSVPGVFSGVVEFGVVLYSTQILSVLLVGLQCGEYRLGVFKSKSPPGILVRTYDLEGIVFATRQRLSL